MQRRWHFLLAEPLTAQGEAELRRSLTQALQDWRSHGRPIRWELHFPYGRFLEIIAEGEVSGCATDALFRAVLPIAQPLPSDYVFYIVEGKSFVEKFYEIIKKHRARQWPSQARVIEAGAEGLREVPLPESKLRIHL